MKYTVAIPAAVSLALFVIATAVPIGCDHPALKGKVTSRLAKSGSEGGKNGAVEDDAEAAVLNRLARKIDELRQLKIASLEGDEGVGAKKSGVTIPAKSVKSGEIGSDVSAPEKPVEGGDMGQVIEEEEKREKSEEAAAEDAEKSKNFSLRTVARLAMPGKGGSFLTDDEQKGLAEYVRVKMLKSNRDVVRLPMDPVVRNALTSKSKPSTAAREMLSKAERETLSRLVRSNGFKIGSGADAGANDLSLGAFVRAALSDSPEPLGATKVGLSLKDAENMSLKI